MISAYIEMASTWVSIISLCIREKERVKLGYTLMQVRYEEIMSESAYLDRILAEGATKAADIADATLNNVYQAMGFLRR